MRSKLSIRKTMEIVCFLGLLTLGSGCAVNRGILDIRIQPTVDPASSNVVKITKVVDSRKFELKPSSVSTPSLKDGQIDNKAITLRAIARKRNGWGKAMGDILLPEGRTVEDLVRELVQKALRDKGYSVITDPDVVNPGAVALEVEIHKFWSWLEIGFWALALEFNAELDIKSSVLVNGNEQTVQSSTLLHSQAATGRAWRNTINKGIEDLIEKTKEKIKNP